MGLGSPLTWGLSLGERFAMYYDNVMGSLTATAGPLKLKAVRSIEKSGNTRAVTGRHIP